MNMFDELDDIFFDIEDEQEFLSDEERAERLIRHRLEQHPDCGDPLHPGCDLCLIGDIPNIDQLDFSSMVHGYE